MPILARQVPPYHVHYMAWRLGTWKTEANFGLLDRLLAVASRLSGWADESGPLLSSADFGQYWSLIWQLQVAAKLVGGDATAEWVGGAGPDLRVTYAGSTTYVECYSYQKKSGPIEFLRDLCRFVHASLRVKYDLALPLELGSEDVEDALDALCRPLLDLHSSEPPGSWSGGGDRVLSEVAGAGRLRIVVPPSDPTQVHYSDRTRFGDPEQHLLAVLREVVRAKQGRNQLATCRPNVVAVNVLLDGYQLSARRQDELGIPWMHPDLPGDIDAVAIASCGIDTLSPQFHRLIASKSQDSVLPHFRPPPVCS